jgi:hypothetical protein
MGKSCRRPLHAGRRPLRVLVRGRRRPLLLLVLRSPNAPCCAAACAHGGSHSMSRVLRACMELRVSPARHGSGHMHPTSSPPVVQPDNHMPRSFTARRTSMNACEANVVEALLHAGATRTTGTLLSRVVSFPPRSWWRWHDGGAPKSQLGANLDSAPRGAVNRRSLPVRARVAAAVGRVAARHGRLLRPPRRALGRVLRRIALTPLAPRGLRHAHSARVLPRVPRVPVVHWVRPVCPRACAAGRARAPPLLSHVSKTHMVGLCSPAGASRQTGIFRVRYIPFMVGGRQGYGGMLCRAATRPSTVYGGIPVGLFGCPIIP